jgi:hypothetical protein
MDPVSMLVSSGIGLGLQGVGTVLSSSAISDANQAQLSAIKLEQKQEALRRQQMEFTNKRLQLENLRKAQQAKAIALTVSTSQGASKGSGLQGGYGQIAGQTNWNQQGLGATLGIGQGMFDLNAQISQQKMNYAQANQEAQFGQGISALGGHLVNSSKTFGQLFASSDNRSASTGTAGFNPFGFTGSFY